MDVTGERLHPNWQALATVHIPLKRFIKEGTPAVQKEICTSKEQYEISGIKGDTIKQFYEELVAQESGERKNFFNKDSETNLTHKSWNQNSAASPVRREFKSKQFFMFAMENKVNELENINFEGQNINICDQYGWSALMMASCAGAYEAVEFLLKIGADKLKRDNSGRTAKDLALKNGHLNIVALLEKSHINTLEKLNELEAIQNEPFHCEICNQSFKETSKNQHYTSTLHQFSIKSNLPVNKLQKFNISARNKGLQLMVKQGWDKESGLGPSQTGRLYPVKTVIRKQRTGLGVEQEPARVTHFESYDYEAVQRLSPYYLKKKSRNRNDIRREKVREWKRDRRLRNELN